MNRALKIAKTLRNHWKKSTFAVCFLSYGIHYGKDKMRTNEMMRAYCEEAIAYGRIPISQGNPKHITVILNPAAKKKKSKANFEKYCAPLLHLAGMYVSIVQTDSEGQARGLMEVMNNTDAVVIAGGDGTLSEAVTGLMRRPDNIDIASRMPMAILPLGRTNAVASSIFGQETNEAKFMAEATMALIRGTSKRVDIMKIEQLQAEADETPAKPVFAVAEVQWGAFRDAHSRRDKYWIWGPLRAYAAAVFCWPKNELEWDCEADLSYVTPCDGCKLCQGKFNQAPQQELITHGKGRWWHAFIPKQTPSRQAQIDYSKISNPDCGQQHMKSVSTIDLSIATSNARHSSEDTCKPQLRQFNTPELKVSLGSPKTEVSFSDFVSEMWSREKGQEPVFAESLSVRELWLRPVIKTDMPKTDEDKDEPDRWLSIDQENFELKSMHITLLPKIIRLFCPAEQVTVR